MQAPFIKCVATEEGQAGNTYGAIEVMLREGPAGDTPGLDVGRTRTFLPGGGEIRAVSAAAASKDGGKETFVNFDETHLYVGEQLVGLHATLRRNLAKRKAAEPWSLETTTMYAPGEMSVAEVAHIYAAKIHQGEIRDGSFLFDHRQGPPVVDFHDDGQIVASLREAYGEASAWMDFDRLLAEAAEARADVDHRRRVADFKRYFLNQPTAKQEAVWIPPGVWSGLADGGAVAPGDGARVGVGVERDVTGTLAAVAWAWQHAGRTHVRCRVFTSRKRVPAHDTVDGDQVPDRVLDDMVLEVVAGQEASVHRDERFWAGVEVSDRGVPVDGMTSSEMFTAAQRFHQAAHAGVLAHDGDEVLAGQVAETRAVENDSGWRIVKARAAVWPVATVAAVRAVWSLQADRASAYETRELLVL